ncbi:Sialic acid-binding Ig-like lectin 5 [Myotis brandtii]|uniref:Sialic acid-binding Ig-like lectin 5 n=1 Tax=Myotis brandtii TaxID=109478 RepID=S7MVK3_MYOBR|nr:Sialic acid-binding Ig-like lectin 5 [Myotis brandtii]
MVPLLLLLLLWGVLAKPLGIQGDGTLTCMSGGSPSLASGPGCLRCPHRRQATRRPKVTNDEDPVMDTVTWSSKQKLGLDKPPNQGLSTEDPPLSEEHWEVYYGNLSFHGMKPQEPEDPEATSSINEYSEI